MGEAERRIVRVRRLAAAVAALLLATAPGLAGGTDNRVRLAVNRLSPTGELSIVKAFDAGNFQVLGLTIDVEATPARGYLLGYERMLTRRLSLDLDVTDTTFDVDARSGVSGDENLLLQFPELLALDGESSPLGEVGARVWTLGLNFYLLRRERFELYLSLPRLGLAQLDDLEVDAAGFLTGLGKSVPVDDGLVLGTGVGIHVPLGTPRFTFSSSVRYLTFSGDFTVELETPADSEMEIEPIAESLDFDPLVYELGLAFRF